MKNARQGRRERTRDAEERETRKTGKNARRGRTRDAEDELDGVLRQLAIDVALIETALAQHDLLIAVVALRDTRWQFDRADCLPISRPAGAPTPATSTPNSTRARAGTDRTNVRTAKSGNQRQGPAAAGILCL